MTTFDEIKSYYEHILQRPATDDEASGWASTVESANLTLQQVRQIFIGSEEGQHVQDVIRLYQASFNRVPDQGGLKAWVNSGYSLQECADGFTNSEEFLNLYGTKEPTEEFITSLYKNVLGREPDADGLSNWMNSGLSASEMLKGFAESEEFRIDTANWVSTYLDRAAQGKDVYAGSLYNDAPVTGEPVKLDAMEEDGTIIITAEQLLKNVVDVDGDDLTLVVVPDSGDLVDNGDGTWTFTPAADFNGFVNFSVTVSDGLASVETTASLEVTPVNDAPVITGAEITRIGKEIFTLGIMEAPLLGVTQTAVVTDAEGNFDGGSVRIDISGKFEGNGIFFAEAEGDEIVGKFYLVGTNVVMRAGVAGNDIDTVVGTYKTGFVDGQVQGEEGYGTQEAGEATYALVTLNANATAEIVTEMLKNVRLGYVDEREGDLNVKVTVTDGDGLSADFTRLLDVEGPAQMTKDDESPYESVEEVELRDRGNHSLAIEEIDFDSNGSVMNGATITVFGDNWTDKIRLNATNALIEDNQARFILNVNGTYDVSIKDDGEEIVIGTTASLPKAGDQLVITLNEKASDSKVEILLNSLTVDMSSDLGARTFTVVYESAKGPKDLVDTDRVEIQMTRTVVGDFKEVTMAALIAATVLNPKTIDSNTRIILDGTQALDIEKAIEDAKIIVSGEGHLIRLVSSTDADISGVTGLDKLGTFSLHKIGEDLTISAEQANNTKGTVAADKTLTVTGIENLLGLDLSKLNAGEGSIKAILVAATDLTFSGDLGEASLEVTGSGKLSVSADLATGKTITYTNGTIIITDLGTSPYNLSEVKAAGGQVLADVKSDLEVNKDAQLGDLELAVSQNATLTLTATQADDRTITGSDVNGNGNKGASVIVTDLVNDTDLREIQGSTILVGATNATKSDLIVQVTGKEGAAVDGVLEVTGLNLGSFIVKIDEGATLKTDSSSVDGDNIQGAGSIIVMAEGLDIDVDLSKIVVTGDKTLEVGADGSNQPSLDEDADIGDFKVVVANDATFSLTAAQATGKTITGADAVADDVDTQDNEAASGGSVTITLDGDAAYDLSNIKAGAASAEEASDAGKLIAIATDDVVIDAGTKLGDFAIEMRDGTDNNDDEASLTLSAEQADGRTITVDESLETATVTVTDLAAETDLSGIATDADVTAEVNSDLDISANTNLLGHVDIYRVLDGKVLTLSAIQAHDVSITALADADNATNPGTVVIAGDVVADLDGNGIIEGDEQEIVVNLEKVGLGLSFDDGSIDVGYGVTLELTAEQANGKVITGAGNVMVTGLAGTAIDLSKITVTGEKVVEVGQDATLNAATKLGTFTLDLDTHELTVSSTQAASLDKVIDDEGDGGLVVLGTQISDNLDFSGKADWKFGSLTIDGSGGADYLKAPLTVQDITFTGGLGADNYDVQGNQRVMITDFNMQVDELSIAKDGAAFVGVTGVADFASVEAGNRLDNKGVMVIWGSEGADTITGSSGVNYMFGADGDDKFVYKANQVDSSEQNSPDAIYYFGLDGEEESIETANDLLTLASGQNIGANEYKLVVGNWSQESEFGFGTFTEETDPDLQNSTMIVFDADKTKAGAQEKSIVLVGIDPNDIYHNGGIFYSSAP